MLCYGNAWEPSYFLTSSLRGKNAIEILIQELEKPPFSVQYWIHCILRAFLVLFLSYYPPLSLSLSLFHYIWNAFANCLIANDIVYWRNISNFVLSSHVYFIYSSLSTLYSALILFKTKLTAASTSQQTIQTSYSMDSNYDKNSRPSK